MPAHPLISGPPPPPPPNQFIGPAARRAFTGAHTPTRGAHGAQARDSLRAPFRAATSGPAPGRAGEGGVLLWPAPSAAWANPMRRGPKPNSGPAWSLRGRAVPDRAGQGRDSETGLGWAGPRDPVVALLGNGGGRACAGAATWRRCSRITLILVATPKRCVCVCARARPCACVRE